MDTPSEPLDAPPPDTASLDVGIPDDAEGGLGPPPDTDSVDVAVPDDADPSDEEGLGPPPDTDSVDVAVPDDEDTDGEIYDVNTSVLDDPLPAPDVFDVNTVVLDEAAPTPDVFDVNTVVLDGGGSGQGAPPPQAPAPATPPAEGSEFAEYLLERTLGTGGQGAVYVGLHRQLGVRHAVKLVRMADLVSAQRFGREARALAALDGHPGVVRVFNCGVLDGWGYLACDLIEGVDLHEAISRGPFVPHEAARVTAAVARALAHVHAAGIVHRDLKPSNVLLSGPSFDASLTDFGLAQVEDDMRLTEAGKVVGTPTYMAPEQVLHRPVGPPTDVYCLGVILHEMLTGRKLFTWSTLTEARGRLHEPIAPPSRTRPDVPPELDRLVAWMLAASPDDRPSAAVIALHLSAHVEGDAAPTGSGFAPPLPPRGRHRVGPWIAAGVLAAAALVGVRQGLRSQRLGDLRTDPEPRRGAALREALRASDPDEQIARLADADEDAQIARALDALRAAKQRASLLDSRADDPDERVHRLTAHLERYPDDAFARAELTAARQEQTAAALAAALTPRDPQTRHQRLQTLLLRDPDQPLARSALAEVAPWEEGEPAARPSPRTGHCMVWVAEGKRALLFGGYGEERLDDTWTYDGATWSKLLPAAHPTGRSGHGMSYDPVRRRVLLFGGEAEDEQLPRGTWEWDGENWTRLVVDGPPPRDELGMTHDPGRGVTVLFGGEGEEGRLDDTWLWHGEHWSQLETSTRPAARRDHVLVYDPNGKRVLLAGGRGARGRALSDVWAWSGEEWAQLPWELPAARRDPGLVVVPGAGLLLFGGRGGKRPEDGATWLRADSRWHRLHPFRAPRARYGHGLIFDPERRQVLLFGGRDLRSRSRRNDTWTLRPSTP